MLTRADPAKLPRSEEFWLPWAIQVRTAHSVDGFKGQTQIHG